MADGGFKSIDHPQPEGGGYETYSDEVEEVLSHHPRYRFIEIGDVENEDLYAALGQTEAGRYLTVYFVYKTTGEALVVSARDMTKKERKSYAKK